MSEAANATITTAASLASLWTAMNPRPRPVAPLPPADVGAIAAAADAQGFARGRAETEAGLARERAALAAAIAELQRARVIDAETLRPLLVDLVTRIAAAAIDLELRSSLAPIERLVATALAAIEDDGATIVYLCPDHAARLNATADPDLAPGEVRVETPQHVVAASLAARLAAVVADLA